MLAISRSLEGHRESYLKFFLEVFGGKRSSISKSLASREVVFFLMIEESFFIFFTVSIIRAIFRLKTGGLLFRPRETVELLDFRHKLKYKLLRFLKKFSSISTISIVPSFLIPGQKEIVKDWIYDFQLWDLNFTANPLFIEEKLSGKILPHVFKIANKRMIICSLGVQNIEKGVDQFMRIYCQNVDLRSKYLFVCAGKISGIHADLIQEFLNKGGLIYNEFISNSDLIALYNISDFIWAWYSPRYDQASGIAGRALQLGSIPILRSDSLIQRLFSTENIPHLSCKDSDLHESFLSILAPTVRDRAHGISISKRFSDHSINKLKLLLN